MEETSRLTCDFAVIGGGIAGMVAAVRAAQGGKRVLVFEKSSEDRYMCNSRITAGVFHCAMTDILTDPKELEDKILQITGGYAHHGQARAVAKDGIRAVRWLQNQGIRFIKGQESYHNFMLSPPTVTTQGRQWEGRGGDVLLRTLEAALNKNGGQIHRGHRVNRLCKEGERCVGVTGLTAGGKMFEVTALNTLLADGGFQGDPELMRGPVTPAPEKVFQRNARTGTGDGLRMAREFGAQISDMRGFYGHILSRDAFTNDKLWPYPWLDFVASAGILAGRDGRRFCDEGLGAIYMANEIALLVDPLSATVIADQTIWNGPGAEKMLAPNPRLVDAGATAFKASSLAELAVKAGIAPGPFVKEVEGYNDAIRARTPNRLAPERSTHKFQPYPIEKQPFYAFPVCAGVTYTMGGVSIDEFGRIIHANGQVIQGLYAAGSTTGGLEGGEKRGYVGGLIKSAVTGLRVAEYILGTLQE